MSQGKQEVVEECMGTLGVDLPTLTAWYCCESRRQHPEGTYEPCKHCGSTRHPDTRDPEALSDPQQRYETLCNYVRAQNAAARRNHNQVAYNIQVVEEVASLFALSNTEKHLGVKPEALMLWYECERKRPYATLAQAEENIQQDTQHAYRCQHGEHYHVGTGSYRGRNNHLRSKKVEAAAKKYKLYRRRGKLRPTPSLTGDVAEV